VTQPMTAEMSQFAGLVGAVGVYGAAITVTPAAVLVRIRRLPADWHSHPDLRDLYSRRPRPQPLPMGSGSWPRALFLATAVISGSFALTGPSVRVELGVCMLGAGMMTAGTARARRAWSSVQAAALGLDAVEVDAALSPVYRGGMFVACAGLLGIACFVGGLLGTLL
jgi:hypothetical protein